ncbi:MAG TPA: NUDIX domain-containing protein [Propioniciclava tarda]|nr:NUDIX domain-containing protein [Propioniciclava tarda]HQA31606.1 NUDIX domain-containing protein [Propioniciclava tarda]HQD61245.1 NUDIX domain-containing protein [Propioniciclava tarda]
MAVTSAGILPFARDDSGLWVFIVHMGGPFWTRKDAASWSLAKGLYDAAEETPEDAARREFTEETGAPVPPGELIDLGEVRLSSGKQVRGFAVETSRDLAFVSSNSFEVEWPPRSGIVKTYPEVDKAEWCLLSEARKRLVKGQVPLLDALERLVG